MKQFVVLVLITFFVLSVSAQTKKPSIEAECCATEIENILNRKQTVLAIKLSLIWIFPDVITSLDFR